MAHIHVDIDAPDTPAGDQMEKWSGVPYKVMAPCDLVEEMDVQAAGPCFVATGEDEPLVKHALRSGIDMTFAQLSEVCRVVKIKVTPIPPKKRPDRRAAVVALAPGPA